jgi:ribosomal protein S18 acetylase RimI-like enzyme
MAGENYGLFVDDELAVVLSLRQHEPLGWEDYISGRKVMWLSTLNTAEKFRGRKLGEVMLDHVEAYLSEQKVDVLYLDCYYGFLSDYYAAHGFEWIARRELYLKTVVCMIVYGCGSAR